MKMLDFHLNALNFFHWILHLLDLWKRDFSMVHRYMRVCVLFSTRRFYCAHKTNTPQNSCMRITKWESEEKNCSVQSLWMLKSIPFSSPITTLLFNQRSKNLLQKPTHTHRENEQKRDMKKGSICIIVRMLPHWLKAPLHYISADESLEKLTRDKEKNGTPNQKYEKRTPAHECYSEKKKKKSIPAA